MEKRFTKLEGKMVTAKLSRLSKSAAMVCFGGLVRLVELDPDPTAQNKLQGEFNCKNCGNYQYCEKLADTLK